MNPRSKKVDGESIYFNNDPMAKRGYSLILNSNYTKIN